MAVSPSSCPQLHSALSRTRLNLETIDVIYVHSAIKLAFYVYGTHERAMAALQETFDFLEYARAQNWIRYYGISSGDDEGIIAALDSPLHVHLEELVAMAERARLRHGHAQHGLRMVMFYFNVRNSRASGEATQLVNGKLLTAFNAMQQLGIVPVPIRLLDPLLKKRKPLCPDHPALASLDAFEGSLVLSASAVADRGVAVVGQGSIEHARTNLKYMQLPLLSLEEVNDCVPKTELGLG